MLYPLLTLSLMMEKKRNFHYHLNKKQFLQMKKGQLTCWAHMKF